MPIAAAVAEAPTARQPNRPLAILLLLVTVAGSLATVSWGTWQLLEGHRLTGFAWLSIGLLWFLFFSWLGRGALRPGPQG